MPASVACCAASLEQSSGTESGKEQAIFLQWLRGRGYDKGKYIQTKMQTNSDKPRLDSLEKVACNMRLSSAHGNCILRIFHGLHFIRQGAKLTFTLN